jgi:predicted nuclease of predicted toxin-antitoxin system
MIRSQVQKSKAISSYLSTSVQTDPKNHVKAIDKQFSTIFKSDGNKPSVSSSKSIPESLQNSIGPMRRMVQYVTLRKKQRKSKGGFFPKKRPREQLVAKGSVMEMAHDKIETVGVSHAVLRQITDIDIEKSKKEEEFVLMIHDLVMLSEMTTEGTDEKFALLRQIEVLREEYKKAQKELEDLSDSLWSPQQRDQCSSCLNLVQTNGSSFVQNENSQRHFSEASKFASSGIIHDEDLVCKDQTLKDMDCESMPGVRTIVNADVHHLAIYDPNSQAESKEIDELQSSIALLIAQRDALQTDFEGFCVVVSDLVCNTEDLFFADEKLVTLNASQDALFQERKTLLNDIENEWREQQEIRDSIIESQTREIEVAHNELTEMARESEGSRERAEMLEHDMKDILRRYHENLNSIDFLQSKILEEEDRSASLLLVKDFEHENIREKHDAELIKMKNEVSIISLENILLSRKIAETSADLQYSEKMVNELNANLNEQISLIDHLRTQNAALISEIGKLSDIGTSYQRSAFSEKLELFHELNEARSTILRLQTENTSLSLEHSEFNDSRDQSDMQPEIERLHAIVEKVEAEKEELRRKYLTLFGQVVVLNAENTCQIGILMEKTGVHELR